MEISPRIGDLTSWAREAFTGSKHKAAQASINRLGASIRFSRFCRWNLSCKPCYFVNGGGLDGKTGPQPEHPFRQHPSNALIEPAFLCPPSHRSGGDLPKLRPS